MLPPWHPHYDLWALVVILAIGYWYANVRIRPHYAPGTPGPTTRQWWQWYAGLALMWLVSGYPVHDIGEQSLFTVHMFEHMILALAVPPLLLMGTPRWLADATMGRPGVLRWLGPLAKPIPAFFIFNGMFVLIHWPEMVTLMLTSEVAHFLVHFALFFAAFLMWMPILSPTLAIPKLSRPLQMFYLFCQSLLPTIPASFLTFSTIALYPVYGNAAEAWGLTAVADQTIAGIIMKLGGGLIIWCTIAVIWFRWTTEEREWDKLEQPAGVS